MHGEDFTQSQVARNEMPTTARSCPDNSVAWQPAALPRLPAAAHTHRGGFNDTESLQSWQARRDRQKHLSRNGNGMGMPLAVAVGLLPTPTAVTTWRTPAEHMAWRHDNGRTQPCDLQVAFVLQAAPPDPGEPGGAPPGQAGPPGSPPASRSAAATTRPARTAGPDRCCSGGSPSTAGTAPSATGSIARQGGGSAWPRFPGRRRRCGHCAAPWRSSSPTGPAASLPQNCT
jgi:hypothetical protein